MLNFPLVIICWLEVTIVFLFQTMSQIYAQILPLFIFSFGSKSKSDLFINYEERTLTLRTPFLYQTLCTPVLSSGQAIDWLIDGFSLLVLFSKKSFYMRCWLLSYENNDFYALRWAIFGGISIGLSPRSMDLKSDFESWKRDTARREWTSLAHAVQTVVFHILFISTLMVELNYGRCKN